MSNKWVEYIRYSGFTSEEEARKFLEETTRWFEEVHRSIHMFHEEMDRLFDRILAPTYTPRATPTKPRPTLEQLIQRIEKLEKELKETKEQLIKAYTQQKAKVELH